MKRTGSFLVAGLSLLLAAGRAGAQHVHSTRGGLQIADLSFSPGQWTHGTVEHRFLIENPSQARRTVTIELPGERYGSWQNGVGSLSGTVSIEAGARATLSLIQPPIGLDGSAKFAVSEKGGKRETFSCGARDYQEYTPEEAVSVLLSRSLSAETLSEKVTAFLPSVTGGAPVRRPSKGGVSRPPASVMALRFEREPEAWPENWLAYAGFDGCLVDVSEYGFMSEEARNGLRSYVAAGGSVTFLGGPAPSGWVEPGGEWKPLREAPGLSETRLGFGRVQVLEEKFLSALTSNQVARLAATWTACKEPWNRDVSRHGGAAFSFSDCLSDIPVEGGSKVPVNLFLFTLLAFALAAGPGAVLFVGRTNRRIWLLALVPAISLLFSAAIFAAALMAEGVTPYVRRQAVTLLDQTRRQAATLGAMAVYAPTALGRGLGFDRGTEVTPLIYNRNSSFRSIIWGREQLFAEGWVTPRMAAFFRLRRSETRSERLVVSELGTDAIEIVNALGAPVRRLVLKDGRGRLYRAENVAPGEKRLLKAGEETKDTKADAFEKTRDLYGCRPPGWGLAKALDGKAELSQPGSRSYVAELQGCPFLENPVGERKVKESAESLVAGRF